MIVRWCFQSTLLLLHLSTLTHSYLPLYSETKHEHTISSHYKDLNPSYGTHTYDWDDSNNPTSSTHDQQVYDPPPYGKAWGPARSYGGKTAPEPLYYDPEDPFDGAFNSSLKHYTLYRGKWIPKPTNPMQGAAYLPGGRGRHPDPLHPQFGFVPVNYVNPNWDPKPFRLGGPMEEVPYPHHLGGLSGSANIPVQVPFPITLGGNHPLYADKYYPGVQPGRTKLSYPTPLRGKYKYHAPAWFDGASSWPHPDPERVPTIPFVPPPPPGGGGGEAKARRFLRR